MAGGWVKLHRSILGWCWYQDANTKSLFIHLLITASSEDKPWRNIIVKRGQRIASYNSLAKELQLSQRSVRTALNHLKSTHEVTIETTSEYSIITINNYAIYQDKYSDSPEGEEDEATNQMTSKRSGKRQATDKRPTLSKEDKEVEEVKEVKKREYAPFVHLTEEEHRKIVETVGEEGAAWCIQKLSGHKEAKGTKYKSDMGAMRKWVFDAWEERKRPTGKESNIQRNDRVIDEYIYDYEQGGRNGQKANCTVIEAHKPELPGQ